jgi:hypothetical protein
MEMVPVKSSNIRAVGYESGRMRIEFQSGDVWEYGSESRPVPQAEYELLRDAPSIGQRWNAIKQFYPGAKIGHAVRVTSDEQAAELTDGISALTAVTEQRIIGALGIPDLTALAALPQHPISPTGPTVQTKCPQCGSPVESRDGQQFCIKYNCGFAQRIDGVRAENEDTRIGDWAHTRKAGRW